MTCDICGEEKEIKKLAEYDYEEFPFLRGKKCCDDCRIKLYNKLLNDIQNEEKAEMQKQDAEQKAKGFSHKYTFWIHPGRGDDFAVDIYTNKKLTKVEQNKQVNQLQREYGARLIEEPIYMVL